MALSIATIVLTTSTRNALRDALLVAIDAGTAAIMEIRTGGTPGSGTLLATIPFDATSFTASSPGLLTLAGVPKSDTSADASGVPGNYQVLTQAGGTVVYEGTITGGDTINAGSPVNVTSHTITIPA
jgi:hypothetical protein